MKESSTRPRTTGFASSPAQAALDRTPGRRSTLVISEVSEVGMLTITSLAWIDCR